MKKKECGNCVDYIVCLQNDGKEPNKVCSEWKLDPQNFQELFEEKDMIRITPKEIENYIRENYR
nr:MAG TPA: hypothetical protein [Inoviridae sp.]